MGQSSSCLSAKSKKPKEQKDRPSPTFPVVMAELIQNKIQEQSKQKLKETGFILSDKTGNENDIEWIKTFLKKHYLFKQIEDEALHQIAQSMKFSDLESGEMIYKKGDSGCSLYLIASGKIQISFNQQKEVEIYKGKCFGQRELLTGSKRCADVKSKTKASFWRLQRDFFFQKIKEMNYKKDTQIDRIMESIGIFSDLTFEQLQMLKSFLVWQQFEPGEFIVKQNQEGEIFYVVKQGEVTCIRNGNQVRRFNRGQFFGEQVLLYNTNRNASIQAVETTVVLSLSKSDFKQVIGNQIPLSLYKNSLRIAISNSKVFKLLTPKQIDSLIERMFIFKYNSHQWITSKSDKIGMKIWIILDGELKVAQKIYKKFDIIGQNQMLLPQSELCYQFPLVSKQKCIIAQITREKVLYAVGYSLSGINEKLQLSSILRRSPLLKQLSNQLIFKVASSVKSLYFSDKDIIFKQNQPGNAFYIVSDGKVEIIKFNSVIRTIFKFQFFGEKAILCQGARTATARAKGDIVVWALSRQAFLKILEPPVYNKLRKHMKDTNDNIRLQDLTLVTTLRKGDYQKVFLTQRNRTHFALRVIQKKWIQTNGLSERNNMERAIINSMNFPLISKYLKTFEDDQLTCYLLQYIQGLSLEQVLDRYYILSQRLSRFYTACIIQILQHLHQRSIVCRCVHPRGFQVDKDGYLIFVKFRNSKIIDGRTNTVVGDPHYMAPEMILGEYYSQKVDYWSMGVLVYQFCFGKVPFGQDIENPMEIYEKIVKRKMIFPEDTLVGYFVMSLIFEMLSIEERERGNLDGYKKNQWFQGIDWQMFGLKDIESPFVPELEKVEFVDSNKKLIKKLEQMSEKPVFEEQSYSRND